MTKVLHFSFGFFVISILVILNGLIIYNFLGDLPGVFSKTGHSIFPGDFDGDGILDGEDNCPEIPNPLQEDSDGDGVGDYCEEASGSTNDPGTTGDADQDGIPDAIDNCPLVFNPEQEDFDLDAIGDACDSDPLGDVVDGDEDGILDSEDNCPDHYNPDQLDFDYDSIGDACDETPQGEIEDEDQDGIPDEYDNCELYNPEQRDENQNGVGDACESTGFDDRDSDGHSDSIDNCKEDYNPLQEDSDGDGEGDVCDDTPLGDNEDPNDESSGSDESEENEDEEGDADTDDVDTTESSDETPNDEPSDDGTNLDDSTETEGEDQSTFRETDTSIDHGAEEDSIEIRVENAKKELHFDSSERKEEQNLKPQFSSPSIERKVLETETAIIQEYIGREEQPIATTTSPATEIIEVKRKFVEKKKTTMVELKVVAQEPLTNFRHYESIPKSVASSVSEISFANTDYIIIEDDPLVMWHFQSIPEGAEVDLSYTVNDVVTEEEKEQIVSVNTATKQVSIKPKVQKTGFASMITGESGSRTALFFPMAVIVATIITVVVMQRQKPKKGYEDFEEEVLTKK